ncbi:MAG: hypothetical protein K2P35_12320, partial [Lachnospiraceae bacterium]|nr:hypothetical protein [Lachnospiraceae bacterium]
MESTRLRELTHASHVYYKLRAYCRNGGYPIKGIDTSFGNTQINSFNSRNGGYPIKGIDTFFSSSLASSFFGRNGGYPNKGIGACVAFPIRT